MDERTEQAFVDTLRKAAEAHRELQEGFCCINLLEPQYVAV